MAKKDELKSLYAKAEATAMHEPTTRWLWRSEDGKVGVLLHDGECFTMRQTSRNAYQVTLNRYKVTATYDVWCGGRTDECGCGRPECKHLKALKELL